MVLLENRPREVQFLERELREGVGGVVQRAVPHGEVLRGVLEAGALLKALADVEVAARGLTDALLGGDPHEPEGKFRVELEVVLAAGGQEARGRE